MQEWQLIEQRVLQSTDVKNAVLPEEYYYTSISLCLIDAVFSIGVKYEGVKNVIARYCDYFNIDRLIPGTEESLDLLEKRFSMLGTATMMTTVFCNRQLTSTRGGISKAEAVRRFANALIQSGILTKADITDERIENAKKSILQIPGQNSGTSFKYFLMMVGDDDKIKPDRMIERFIESAIGRTPKADEMQMLLENVGSSDSGVF